MKKLFLSILLLSFFVTPASGLEITFKQKTEVQTDYITLGDLVTFDENNELTSALATKIVAQSPEPGTSATFNSVAVKNKILRKTSLSRYTQWSGSPTVTVIREGQQIVAGQLTEAIDTYLQDNSNELPEAEINFIPRTLPLPFMLPKGRLSIEVIPSNPSILKSSRFSLILRVDGKVRENLSLQGEMKALAPVVIAADSLARGTILTPGNTKIALKDLTEHDNPFTNKRNILGKRLKRSVRVNNVISTPDVEIPPLVKRGQLVKIIVSRGNLHLTATGVARSDGKQGQVIRVQNANSNKLIQGVVTAPGIVEVMI